MVKLPQTEQTIVLRTDFSDDGAWEQVKSLMRKPSSLFGAKADLLFVSDTQYQNLDVETLAKTTSELDFLFVVDAKTIKSSERLVLCVDLLDTPGRSFRFAPAQTANIENNLALANMDFDEFADYADENDGIFRGFDG